MKTAHRPTQDEKSGFTLIELSFAMAFIAVLMIAITIVATNIIGIYQKGLTLKAVNSVGRGLVDEFTAAINSAPSVDTRSICSSLTNDAAAAQRCETDRAFAYIYQEQRSTPDSAGNSYQYNGIFCTGHYSYMWNTYYGIDQGRTVGLRYRAEDAIGKSYTEIAAPRLIRIVDRNYRLCSSVVDGDYQSHYANYGGANDNAPDYYLDIQTLAHSSPSDSNPLWNPIPTPQGDMLREFDLDLMLYGLTIFPINQDAVTLRTYMSGMFILATLRGNVDIMRTGSTCDLHDPTGSGSILSVGSEYNYCAINKFNFAARTAGSGV